MEITDVVKWWKSGVILLKNIHLLVFQQIDVLHRESRCQFAAILNTGAEIDIVVLHNHI